MTCVTSELSHFADVTFSAIGAETSHAPITLNDASDQLVQFDLRSSKGAQLANVSALSADANSFDIGWVGNGP